MTDTVVFAHPGCAPFAQHGARALHEAGLLAAYVTTFNYNSTSPLGRFLRFSLRARYRDSEKQLARRQITELPVELIRSYPLPEMIRMAAAQVGPIPGDLVWERTEKWFDSIVSRRHLSGTAAVYGYEHACLQSFRTQKDRGGLCLYEMSTSHHRETFDILYPEFEKYPETVTAYDRHLRRLAPRRNERKDSELQLADFIITYSTFAKRSLIKAGVPHGRIAVLPLAAPPISAFVSRQTSPFIFLSAGNQTVRKGIHYLLQSWRKLAPTADAELWLVGQMGLPQRLLENLPGKVVRRASMPRCELFEIYRRAGALVFPSLCDGFGLVITEAMSQGLAVIASENTGGPDLIQQGRNGFLVPIRDADRLAEVMQWCLDHRSRVAEIGQEGARTAASWQWSDYRVALAKVVRDVLADSRIENRIPALATVH